MPAGTDPPEQFGGEDELPVIWNPEWGPIVGRTTPALGIVHEEFAG